MSTITAYHEAGHAVVALHLGVGIGREGVSAVREGDADGWAHIRRGFTGNPAWESSPKLTSGIEKRVMATLAGMAAQRRYSPSSVRRACGSSDRKNAASLLGELVGSEEELDAYLNLLNIRVQNLVSTEAVWIQIVAVAEALEKRLILTGPQVKEIAADAIQRHITEAIASAGPRG